jgi:hypothetical protein
VAGQRAAVYRYNHSTSYVNLVLRIMNNYLAGDFSSVPDGTTAAGYIVPEPPVVGTPPHRNQGGRAESPEASIDAAPQTPPNDGSPRAPRDNRPADPEGGTNPGVKVPPLSATTGKTVDRALTLAQAIVQCTLDGISKLNLAQWNACIQGYRRPG